MFMRPAFDILYGLNVKWRLSLRSWVVLVGTGVIAATTDSKWGS